MSSFFDDASLVMIPSGYKTSKVYSVKPTDGSGDLTFSRSNDTATRVNSAGLIEKVRTNLATYSEQLNNSSGWGFEQLAVTANAVANPLDGAVTADKIYATVTGSSVPILKQYTAATANQTITVSGYFKKAEYDYVVIHGFGLGGTVFNLAAGTKSGAGTITSVGNGWYRCAAVLAMSGDARTFITPSVDGNVGYTSTANSGVYAFGMQFELGDIATDYIATTSAAVSVGPVANVPRLDYLNSSCPRLLLEPQRTNLFTYSEQFNNAAYILNNATITANSVASPDGYTNADTYTAAGSNNYLNAFGSSSGSNTITYSVFVKAGTQSVFRIREAFYFGTSTIFNLSTGTVTSGTGTITSYGNGWYRCTMSQAYGSGQGNLNIIFDTTASSGTFYLYGAQAEAGAYATSYIPTLGAAVTRGADACSKTGISSLIGQTEGTFFAEVTLLGNTGNFNVLNTENTTTNSITLHIEGSQVRGYVYANSVLRNSIIGGSLSVGNTYKMAYAYKSGDAALYLNGIQIGTASQTWAFSASVSKIELADPDTYFSYQEGIKFAQALLFKTRLTNAQLAELTTL